MKTTAKFFLVACTALAVLAVSCASSGGGSGGSAAPATPAAGTPGVFSWGVFNDMASGGSSTISMIEDVEDFGGEILPSYAFSGEITNQYEYGYAGWYAIPDEDTLTKMQSAESFSFQVLGDGQTYEVMFCISDIEDSSHYRTTFNTKKDQVSTVTIKLTSLAQPEYWGVKKPFNKANATQLQWQTTNNGTPGTFKLKIWDVRIN